jgi:hypothetical protein
MRSRKTGSPRCDDRRLVDTLTRPAGSAESAGVRQDEHLAKLRTFWSAVVLMSGQYYGQPARRDRRARHLGSRFRTSSGGDHSTTQRKVRHTACGSAVDPFNEPTVDVGLFQQPAAHLDGAVRASGIFGEAGRLGYGDIFNTRNLPPIQRDCRSCLIGFAAIGNLRKETAGRVCIFGPGPRAKGGWIERGIVRTFFGFFRSSKRR